MQHIGQQVDKMVVWLREKVTEANAIGLLVGVSGGVDSSVVAALIKKAFPDRSLGLILPCSSNPQDEEDAALVCQTFGLKYMRVDLTEPYSIIYNSVMDQLKEGMIAHGANELLADANLRARLRMATLYTFANALNYLVVGTDNAAEVYCGYFTKYGDGAVDLLVLSEFTKREVRALARFLGIPDRIIAKAPSAGLWQGQTDEEEMGVTYDMIDDFLEGKDIPEGAREKIEELHRRTEHKRHLPPSYHRDDR